MDERSVVSWLVKDFGLSIRSVEHVVTMTGEYLAKRARHLAKVSVQACCLNLPNLTRTDAFVVLLANENTQVWPLLLAKGV